MLHKTCDRSYDVSKNFKILYDDYSLLGAGQDKQSLMERQMAFVVNHRANPLTQNRVVIWLVGTEHFFLLLKLSFLLFE